MGRKRGALSDRVEGEKEKTRRKPKAMERSGGNRCEEESGMGDDGQRQNKRGISSLQNSVDRDTSRVEDDVWILAI